MHKTITLIIITVLIIIKSSLYIVYEGQKAIITRFDKILRNTKNHNPILLEPGLHFKIPFIDTIKPLDIRIHTMNMKSNHFISKDHKEIIVDSYIQWRINDIDNYYMSTGGSDSQAEMILNNVSNDILSIQIGNLYIKDIINDLHNNLTKKMLNALNNAKLETQKTSNDSMKNKIISNNLISDYKDKITKIILHFNSMAILGIKIVDVQINNINFPSNELKYVFNRIISENKLIAQNEILNSQEEFNKSKIQADHNAKIIVDKATNNALSIRENSELQAEKMLIDSFNNDIEFYTFILNLNAYKTVFNNKKDLVILNLDNDFFKYMKNPLINKY
ncbi:protease modulator HflC [Candidatus Pantoea edessiphila]|nr:protease modulator HflC [Candidatus Pantoea edessiphila]